MKRIFVLGKPTDLEESLTCEFKEVRKSPVTEIADKVDEYLVAYLNEVSGSVYWGIRDRDSKVTGVRLDHQRRDQLRQVVGQKVAAVAPPVSSTCYQLPFHKVVSAEGEHSTVEDTFVVELCVRVPSGGGLYFTEGGAAYRKTLGGRKRLTGAELHNALLTQFETKVKHALVADGVTDYSDLSMLPSVERRARIVRPLLKGARTLWVDDYPSNNLYERTMLASLGVAADVALDTEEAVYMTLHAGYDLILSDMNRGSNNRAGMDLLQRVRARGLDTPIVFYVGTIDQDRPTPAGAFAITNRPDELMHYIFDLLERRDV